MRPRLLRSSPPPSIYHLLLPPLHLDPTARLAGERRLGCLGSVPTSLSSLSSSLSPSTHLPFETEPVPIPFVWRWPASVNFMSGTRLPSSRQSLAVYPLFLFYFIREFSFSTKHLSLSSSPPPRPLCLCVFQTLMVRGTAFFLSFFSRLDDSDPVRKEERRRGEERRRVFWESGMLKGREGNWERERDFELGFWFGFEVGLYRVLFFVVVLLRTWEGEKENE